MTNEYTVERAFWNFLKVKGISETAFEDIGQELAKIQIKFDGSFIKCIGECESISCTSDKEKALVYLLNEFYKSMTKEHLSCQIDLSNLNENEKNSFMKVLDSNGVELYVGVLYGEKKSAFEFHENGMLSCELFTHNSMYIAKAFSNLLKMAGITSNVKVFARSEQCSYEMIMLFENANLKSQRKKDYYDNHIALEKLEKKLAERGVTPYLEGLDESENSFVIAREYPKVFEQFLSPEITQYMYWIAGNRGDDALEIMQPKTFEELKFLLAVAYYSESKEQMASVIAKYIARRDGKEDVPANLQEKLKSTYGLCIYDTQMGVDDSIQCEFLIPAIELNVCATANAMYKFAYLCMQYGVHKILQ